MERKRALVTGASEGIGREFAKQLAVEDFELTLVSRNELRLKTLLQELPGEGHQIKVADLSKPEGVEQIKSELRLRHYHLLVNNAGKGLYGKFQERSDAEIEEILKLNCDALAKLAHVFLQQSREGDALINVGSVLSFLPLPFSGIYSATKAFVASLSQSLWYEQKRRNVYVMALCPGPTESEFHKRSGQKTKPATFLTQSSESVVKFAIKNLKKRKQPILISGHKNVILTFAERVFSKKALVNILGNTQERVR